jgi:hypothetical protein
MFERSSYCQIVLFHICQAPAGRARCILPRLVKRYSDALKFTVPGEATNPSRREIAISVL